MRKSFLILSLMVIMTLFMAVPVFAAEGGSGGGGGFAPDAPVALVIQPAADTIEAGDEITIAVKAVDQFDQATAIGDVVYVKSGETVLEEYPTGLIGEESFTYSNTVPSEYIITVTGGVYSASSTITVTPGAFSDLEIDAPESMKVNERKPVTITIVDAYGNTIKPLESSFGVWLSTPVLMEGKFFEELHSDNNYATGYVEIPAGEVSKTVYYQPLGRQAWEENINTLRFEDYYQYYYGEGIYNEATINVEPAGASYLDYYVDNWEEVVSDASDPRPIKITYTMFDQYGNLQTAAQATPLALYYNNEDRFIKLYADAACQNEITNSTLTIPVGQVSASVYVISTKSNDYYYYDSYYYGYGYEYVGAKLPGMTYTEGPDLHFYPDKAAKMSFSADPYEIENVTKALKNEEIEIYLSAWDKFGNKTFYYDRYLTADLSSSPSGGYFYDDYDELITQITVQNGYGKPVGQYWYGMYFASSTAGTNTISASVPGLTVEPMTVVVSPNQFGLDAEGWVVPDERVGIYSYFYGDVEDETLTYKAYTLNGEVKTYVGKFYEDYNSGVETTTDYGDYIYFEVPANLAEGTNIYIEGTSASLGQTATTILTVRKYEDWGKYLNRGWNIFSTPFALATGNDTLSSVIANDEYIQVAYGYKNGQWYQMTSANPSSLSINPLEAYYVKLSGETKALYFGKTTPTAPPVRALNAGWNLVSPALDINDQEYKRVKPAFYTVWDKTQIAVSPAQNEYYDFRASMKSRSSAWSVVNSDPSKPQDNEVFAGAGYWLYLNTPGNLAGFSTTPVNSFYGRD